MWTDTNTMAPFQSDYPVTSHQCYPSHRILASFLSPAPGTTDNSSSINKHPRCHLVAPALSPSSSLNGLYSTRYFILCVGIKDWKPVQNQAWLGLFIQSCPFTQSVTESLWKQHPWSIHPVKDVIPLGRSGPHLRFISLPGVFWTLFKTHKKRIAQVSLGLRDLKLSQNEPTF